MSTEEGGEEIKSLGDQHMTDGPITASQIQGQGNITLTHSSAKTNEVEVKKVSQTEINQIFKHLKNKKGDEEQKIPQ